MKPERWSEIDELFARALELPAAERGAFLDGACKEDATLREAVQRLLDSDEQARSFLESPAPLTAVRDDEPVGSRLGPHRIDRILGRGGMGTVYLATRDDGLFERQVALKVLHFGTLDPEALQRFRSERQNLARLEHPAIARLYDGGETVEGIPFLVMEYVQGQPINAYCDGKRLSVEDRLRLFLRLLDAVSYAHRNLLVHRDIKPANILVTEDGEPKLLD
ncbi:MAG TPA: serine/threonine-protein kinase, partial [Thermoanaerobaculia bacterium]|nr:serine/threonine-protein kinase [Thermoanaerobaculia bacterium]